MVACNSFKNNGSSSHSKIESKGQPPLFHIMGHGEGNYEADYSREWQISMVKGDDGQWRFTQFAAPGFGPIQ